MSKRKDDIKIIVKVPRNKQNKEYIEKMGVYNLKGAIIAALSDENYDYNLNVYSVKVKGEKYKYKYNQKQENKYA